jgi:hypothetical protein
MLQKKGNRDEGRKQNGKKNYFENGIGHSG